MDRIYAQLREDISFGKFKPGEHLSEKILTELYGVSRVTVREIVGQLASQGYLKIEKNRGATVTKLSIEDVDVIYNILSRCESYAAGLFAKNRPNPKVQELESLHERMMAKESNLDYKAWLELNDVFHELIHSNCGNAILSELIFHTRLRIYRFRMVPTGSNIIKSYGKQHHRILSAILKGNVTLTEQLMGAHMEEARKHRLETLRAIAHLL